MNEAPARILVVDDDPQYRRVIEEILRAQGHLVDTAEDGQAGLEKIQLIRPEVVLTDSVMPRMDGLTLCRLVKGYEAFRSTYVIMLSSRGETAAKVAGLDVGADDYLVKPVDPDELVARVRAGLRLQRAVTELTAKKDLLERLALTDALTNLANRRAFEESLTAEVARSRLSGKPLAILYLDVDHFKVVNDGHGHAVGDAILAAVAELLRRHGRRGDLPARIGGEEFAVLLPETEETNALVVAERIRKAVEETPAGPAGLAITVSIGVAVLDGFDTADGAALVARADAALYRAKSGGRNRVETSAPPAP